MHEYGLWATMEKAEHVDDDGFTRTAAAAASSRPSPASRPTCCARWPPSWSSCCATRRPPRTTPTTRSRRCSTSPGRPPSPRTRCWPGCSRRRTPTTRRRPASSAASPRARCATARPRAAVAIIDTLEEAGLPAELGEDGLIIDVELDQGGAVTWMKSFTDIRLALATRLGVEEGDEDYWLALPDEDPRAQRLRHLPVAGLPPGDPGRGALPLTSGSQDADAGRARRSGSGRLLRSATC